MASAIGSARSQLRAFLWQQQHSVASFTQQIRSMAASTPPGVPPEFAHLSFVAPAQAVADHKAGSTTIIDVRRDDEWEGTHLKDTTHIVLDKFKDPATLDTIIESTISKLETPTVTFTCFQSQRRGPSAAAAVVARLQELGKDVSHIRVLEGGIEAVSKDPELSKNLEGTGAAPGAH